jgi:hypothetical protein
MATNDKRVGSYVGKETQKEIEGNEKDLYRYTTEKFRQKNPIYNPDSPDFKRSREHERKYLESAEDKDDRVRKLKVIASQTDENVPIEKAKYRREQIPTNEALYGMKKGGKVKKYADGGSVDQTQQPTYPFYGNQPQAGGASGGTNQTFNIQPQATAGAPEQQQQSMQQSFKKGGKVSSASKRADGCAIRGKTRA